MNRPIRAGVLTLIVGGLSAACAAPTTSVGRLSPLVAAPPLPPACAAMDGLSVADRALADTLLADALDNEALFTIAGAIKPMSTVTDLRGATLRPDSGAALDAAAAERRDADLARLSRIQRTLDALDCGPLDFVVLPFRAVFDSTRNLSAVVLNRDLLDRALAKEADFFGHWGLAPGADPAVVVTTVEFEERYDRYRGYGVLFGYPAHAVDFFVDAARSGDASGELVPRDFLQMPVHSGQTGRFVYAVEKGREESAEDRAIREAALEVLDAYARRRARYVDEQGDLKAFRLYRDWIAEQVRGGGLSR